MHFEVDRSGEAPLYLQLAQSIRSMIRSGELKPGDKLPTVRELFSQTGLSDGTIRHAYDLLAREGTLILAQGRGTFVCEADGARPGREKRAMAAVDEMLSALTGMGFTARDIQLFLQVRLSRLEETATPLTPVAVVDCNRESLNEAAAQLSDIAGIELSEFLLEDVRRTPEELLSGFALVVTTQNHAHELSTLMGGSGDRIGRVVLSPSSRTVAALARVEADSALGIFCQTQRFAQIIKKGMRLFPHLRPGDMPVRLAGEAGAFEDFLEGLQIVLVSPDYLTYASPEAQAALRGFAESGGKVIPYHHQIDQGSMMYIEERIRALD